MSHKSYVIGVYYGTDSVRSVVMDKANGEEIASSVFIYPRWKNSLYLPGTKSTPPAPPGLY